MPLLTRKSILAIGAVIEIALHERHGPMSASVLARRLGLGRRHLEPVLRAFVHEGLLKTSRGPAGGYELGREPRQISAYDILQAARTLEGIGQPTVSSDSVLAAAVVVPALAQAEREFADALRRISVDDLTQSAALHGLADLAKDDRPK